MESALLFRRQATFRPFPFLDGPRGVLCCAARRLIEGLVEFALVARYEFVIASEQVKYGDHGVFGRAFGEVVCIRLC